MEVSVLEIICITAVAVLTVWSLCVGFKSLIKLIMGRVTFSSIHVDSSDFEIFSFQLVIVILAFAIVIPVAHFLNYLSTITITL